MLLQKGNNGKKKSSAKCPFSKGDRAEYDANYLGKHADIRKEEVGLLTVPEKTYRKG